MVGRDFLAGLLADGCFRVSVDRGAGFRSGFGFERSVERLAGLPTDCAAGKQQLQRIVDDLVASVAFGRRRVETWPRKGTIAKFRACSERRVTRTHLGVDGRRTGAVDAVRELAGVLSR